MEKTMRYVNLTFWEKLFSTIRKLNFPKRTKNVLDLHIMDVDLHERTKPETMKQILIYEALFLTCTLCTVKYLHYLLYLVLSAVGGAVL